MKVVVVGGSGLIGTKLVDRLLHLGHEVVAASPKSGINTITGEGLAEALERAQVVVDLANPPSFEDTAVLEFFTTSGRNLLAAEAIAGVRHHVALSIVGTDRSDNGYFRAKVAQEKLIETSGIRYTIIRSTQCLEFPGGIAASSADGNVVRLSPGLFQLIAADNVAQIVAEVALAAPRNGIVEIAGPERAPFNEIVARHLKAVGDRREVMSDPEARYFRRPGRGALARAVGRGAPRPHWFRRMASPLTGRAAVNDFATCAWSALNLLSPRGDATRALRIAHTRYIKEGQYWTIVTEVRMLSQLGADHAAGDKGVLAWQPPIRFAIQGFLLPTDPARSPPSGLAR